MESGTLAFEIIETEKCIIKIYDDDLLEYNIKEGAVLNGADVLFGKKETFKRRPHTKFYVLAEGIDFFTMTPEAREICASREFSDNTHAIAFYTHNISVMLLGELYNKINKPHVPTKVFYNLDNAREWLNEQRLKKEIY
jgi:hypothetical protein